MMQLYQQAGMIATGIFFGAVEVAFYRVSVQVSSLIPFGLQALQSVMRPRMTRMIRQNEHAKLQKELTWAVRLLFVVETTHIIATIFFSPWLAGLFGTDAVGAALIMTVLSCGQTFSLLCGMNVDALNMSGNAGISAFWSMVALLSVVLMMWPMVLLFGILGPAIAVALSRFIWNSGLLYAAARYTGLHTSVVGKLPIAKDRL
jgi:O-antigen/teichoic acid export membrane protein